MCLNKKLRILNAVKFSELSLILMIFHDKRDYFIFIIFTSPLMANGTSVMPIQIHLFLSYAFQLKIILDYNLLQDRKYLNYL